MKMEINVYDFERMFKQMDRDYYSWEGYQALYEYYDEFEDFELDVVAICCEVTEYIPEDLKKDYGYVLSLEEFKEESGYTEEDEDLQEEYLKALVEEISNNTTVIELDNGSCLVWDY